jgi:NAD(P)-dependent dehydrogenase (short-subunit alcohol dehydrogenase family)
MANRLQGKIALITGAGSVGPGWGNGRAMTVRFAQEGAQVYAADIDQARLDETLTYAGDDVAQIKTGIVDVMQSASIEKMVQDCIEKFGRIDILVNNVGGSAKGGPVEMSEEVWDTQVDYNLKSVFLTCKYALPHMIAQGSGAIINMASTSGTRWTGSAQIAYAATKAGIIQFSKVLAVQYAKQSIRVNTIVPGQLHTPMVETRLAKQRTGGDVSAILEQRQARIPLPFMGDGMDTANAAVFLASDEARFITGTEIVVDGGMSAKCD